MSSELFLPLLFLVTCACGEAKDTAVLDTAPDEQLEDDGYTGCQEVTLDIMGPEEPVVGDVWTVWLHCDDALLTGPTILSFSPPDFAYIDANVATFAYTGVATMRMQVGGYWKEREVTVEEAP